MRIDPNSPSTSLDRKKINDLNSGQSDYRTEFREFIKEHQSHGATSEKMAALLKEIDKAADRLGRAQTVSDLKEYKKLVKSFMEEAVKNGVGMEERHGFNQRGRSKVYKMVSEIDKQLVELTNEVLSKEKKGIDILGRTGQIKGMLINLYL